MLQNNLILKARLHEGIYLQLLLYAKRLLTEAEGLHSLRRLVERLYERQVQYIREWSDIKIK